MPSSTKPFDVIVCGAGHAGVEAALAAARMGATTLLLTGNIDTISQMSCNPAIGGQAKGQIVREIDALGGEMALNTDLTAIQFRLLNESKGEAVRSPRAQCDKKAYQFRMKHIVELQPNLQLFQATVTGLIFARGQVVGCRTNLDLDFLGKTVVATTGTFLRGIMHIGQNKNEGGRLGDFSAKTLSASFLEAGIELRRFKTGTPPRLLGRSLDFTQMQEQKGDEHPTRFAFYDTRESKDVFHVEQSPNTFLGSTNNLPMFHVEQPGGLASSLAQNCEQVSCWMTHTSDSSAQIVRDNLHLSAMYSGEIAGVGPRYCPSIEDKFVRFADKPRHILYLEPEGRNTDEFYVNGLSTSLPFAVQLDLIHSIPGLQKAEVLRPAYAVEYDFAPPTQLFPSLESRRVANLFFAGQINGTSGYEEAGGQGLVAGVNAVCKVRGEEPLIIGRNEGYLGVLIDDLVNKGTNEPYRMFTSRAEHRLLFNHASAELRMAHHAEKHKLLSKTRLGRIADKQTKILKWADVFAKQKRDGITYGDAVRRGGGEVALPDGFDLEAAEVRAEVLYRVTYEGYLKREERQIEKLRATDKIKIPDNFDYLALRGLRKESALKLQEMRPANLGQASRISGVNPVDISILMVAIARGNGRAET